MTRDESDVIGRAIDAARRHLSDAVGNESLCAIGRSGRPVPAVKYHEGAIAALIALRSRLTTPNPLSEAITAARSDLERLDRLAARSEDWKAYQKGGVEAIERIADAAGIQQRESHGEEAVSAAHRLSVPPEPSHATNG